MRATKNMTDHAYKSEEDEFDQLKRGAWTLEEDNLLINYINCNGDGRWNSLAKCAGLKRTGKSCRLRWLNYLKPDTKRGNLTPQEQLVILQLHSKLGNRWSKIASHLPGRTDNEIKNYWRTRVQKQARHLKIDSNSKRFEEALHRFWMPRLLEKVEQNSSTSSTSLSYSSANSTLTIEDTDQNKSATPYHPQTIKQTLYTSSSSMPSQPSNIICASSEYSRGEMSPEMSQVFGDAVFYNSSLQNTDCYSELDMLDFGSDHDMSTFNFELAGNDETIRSAEMAADTYWNMDELW